MLKSLQEHNKESMRLFFKQNTPQPNGIACPKCGAELVDTDPNVVLTSYPPQKHVGCLKCDYTGYAHR